MYNRTISIIINPSEKVKLLILKNGIANQCLWNIMLKDALINTAKNETNIIEPFSHYKSKMKLFSAIDPNGLLNTYKKFVNTFESQGTKTKYKLVDYKTSFQINNLNNFIVKNNKISINRFLNIKVNYLKDIPNYYKIKYANFIVNNNKIKLFLYFDVYLDIKRKYLDFNNSIGLDFSLKHLYVDSNGNKADIPIFKNEYIKRLNYLKSKLKRQVKNSHRYLDTIRKISKINQRISNKKINFLHNLTNELSNKYDVIFVENLSLKQIASSNRNDEYNKNLKFGSRIEDLSYGRFLFMLEYKMKNKGKKLVYIDRNYPSSLVCSNCGYRNDAYKNIKLKVYKCLNCNCEIDRDVNAAINIKKRGIYLFINCISKK